MRNGESRSEKWISKKLKRFKRNNRIVSLVLSLVGIEAEETDIQTWTDEQCLLAEDWAVLVYLKASDNNVRVPEIPDFISEGYH